ncbi:DUF1801 domain-containing protein [Primorskyibacter sp. S187A]|uniref:DUF1801 domain-containing protein n=1 Tax=Primorskyibacter sp. S187A TaxID=3415130 RepID=UPI003C7C89E1
MTNKTMPTPIPVADFLAQVAPERRRDEGLKLDEIFREVTGFEPQMWGESIVGYGRYAYRYASGREGSFLATGFSPRKARHSIYIMPGYSDLGGLLDKLGKYKAGAACLYINKLADIDERVLRRIIKQGLSELKRQWPVSPT